MTPKKKAKLMVERWNGDKVIALKLANENLTIHKENKNKAAVKFWSDVIEELDLQSGA